MSNKDFDKVLKEKLAEIEQADLGVGPDWDRLEESMSQQADQMDESFDQLIKDRLKEVDLSAKTRESWENLEQRMDAQHQRLQSVRISKAFELLAVLFVLWCLVYPVMSSGDQRQSNRVFYAAEVNELHETMAIEYLPALHSTQIQDAFLASYNQRVDLGTLEASMFDTRMDVANVNYFDFDASWNFPSVERDATSRIATETIASATTSGVRQVNRSNDIAASLNNRILRSNTLVNDESIVTLHDHQQRLGQDLQLVRPKNSTNSLFDFYMGAVTYSTAKRIEFGLKKLLAEKNRGLASIEAIKTNHYTYGLELGAKFGAFGLQTGLEYSAFDFGINVSEVLRNGDRDRTSYNLQGQYKLVSVPLLLTFDALNYNGWTIDLLAGIQAELLTKTNWEINESIPKPGLHPLTYEQSSRADLGRFDYKFRSGILDENTRKVGFESDPWLLKLTAGLSVGKRFRSNYGLFGHLKYNYHLQDSKTMFNENTDKFNSLNIGVGVRKYFG